MPILCFIVNAYFDKVQKKLYNFVMNKVKCLTIKQNEQNILIIEKSKFITYSYYVNSVSQVKDYLDRLERAYYDATHICYAYDLLSSGQKCSDDGEPQGTAGKPILDCIQKQGVKNVLVATARYFGGVKLGAGGLVRAYSQSASLVLEKSEKKYLSLCNKLSLKLGYDEWNKIENFLQEDYIKSFSKDFKENVELVFVIDTDYQKQFISKMENILSRKIDCKFLEENYYWYSFSLIKIIIKRKYMEHYFLAKEHTKSDYFVFNEKMFERDFSFKSCDDIFSKDRVDYGTKVLIETVKKQLDINGLVLDMGCGYGAISIILASQFGQANFLPCDINQTAVELTNHNIRLNKIENVKPAIISNAYENIVQSFNYIITNPPIKAGKANLLNILDGAFEHLVKGGKLVFVIKKKHGEDSIKKHLEQIFENVEILKRDSGYYILCATK